MINHPPAEAIERNKAKEPEGERIRAALEDFIKRNRIASVYLDTEKHTVSIQPARHPGLIKNVLTFYGSIYLDETMEVLASPCAEGEGLTDTERLNWLLSEISGDIWSPRLIAWMTETCRDRITIDEAIQAALSGSAIPRYSGDVKK
jgi:hypothetical protein